MEAAWHPSPLPLKLSLFRSLYAGCCPTHPCFRSITKTPHDRDLQLLRRQLQPGVKLCPVVKADCYGHGLELLLDTIASQAVGNTVSFAGKLGGNFGLNYEAQAMVLTKGGSISATKGIVSFKGCDSLIILLDAGTDYLNQRAKGWKQEHPHQRITERLAQASKKSSSRAAFRPSNKHSL